MSIHLYISDDRNRIEDARQDAWLDCGIAKHRRSGLRLKTLASHSYQLTLDIARDRLRVTFRQGWAKTHRLRNQGSSLRSWSSSWRQAARSSVE